LARQAEQDEAAALAEIRRLYDEHPELWQRLGDLAAHAELALINLAAGGNAPAREAMLRKAQELREQLAGPDGSPLETILAATISACWLQAAHADLVAAQARGITVAQGEYHQRRQGRSQKRLLESIKCLATVRKLLRRTPAPVEVATRLGAGAAPRAAGRRHAPLGPGAPVTN
jgi:hypothetical protein